MQRLLTMIAFLMASSASTNAQNDRHSTDRQHNTPPAAIKETFQRDHPSFKDASWQRSSSNQWHAHITEAGNNRQHDTYYNQNGRQVDSHQSMERNEVPQEVDRHVRDHYHANEYEATRIERPGHSAVFQLDIRQKNRHRKIYTDDRGRELNFNDHH